MKSVEYLIHKKQLARRPLQTAPLSTTEHDRITQNSRDHLASAQPGVRELRYVKCPIGGNISRAGRILPQPSGWRSVQVPP
jgi:hypothetical protein